MPNLPLRPCTRPGCPELVTSGGCPKHAKQQRRDRYRAYDEQRLSGWKRGYNGHWQDFRVMFLAKNPLCRDCNANGQIKVATEVHHIHKLRDGGAQGGSGELYVPMQFLP